MSALEQLWNRFLSEDKTYREEFVAAQVKRAIPFQIRAMLKLRGWTQDELADRAAVDQGVISRAANPNYGNLTLNTIIRIAAGFDVAFIGQFVPFSELGRWFTDLSESEIGNVASFTEEANNISILASSVAGASENVRRPPASARQFDGNENRRREHGASAATRDDQKPEGEAKGACATVQEAA